MSATSEPVREPDGKWRVGDHVFETNAQAWRYVDRLNYEPISRSEDVSAWIQRKQLDQ